MTGIMENGSKNEQTMTESFQRLIIIDIDGLRQDVFHRALNENRIPNLASLLTGEHGALVHLDPLSPAPSITFCAQNTIFTGAHPETHGIVGNQFFDRFGSHNGKGPRFYAFDVGDTLAYEDAVLTFTGELGLAGQVLSQQVQTIYERAAQRGLTSTVVYNMVSRGATEWIRPSLIDIARFTKGGGLIGMSAAQYDTEMLEKTVEHLRSGARPDVLTVYFMGLDHTSHYEGPGAQLDYLVYVIDPLISRLARELNAWELLDDAVIAVVSDHGQIEVVPDDRHSLRLSFPFDREMGYLFDSLGLDVHDKPGEAPACDAVVASNGGLAYVYLRRRDGEWNIPPVFENEVLPVARAFWDAHQSGKHAPDLQGALSAVLLRNVEADGWQADYRALHPDGRILPLEEFLADQPSFVVVDAVQRLKRLACPVSGDLLLFSNYADGFYFGGPTVGVHGGLHPEESLAVASLGAPRATAAQYNKMRAAAKNSIAAGTPNLADLVPILSELLGWEES